ncbi:phage tail protein [Bacillus atrophaeus]|uniref:distal tail protein Dit n=1 Tax=Bacillus atrophaeus TaxID=1452 RepID=UPI000D02FC8D|nr:distal tail protein Dit [Bacillus atrophaeus]PRS02380.1 phage tail protein [Bacillus atrophaeus]
MNYQELLPNQWRITFNGVDISPFFYVKSTGGRGVMGREVNTATIGNRPGGFLRGTRIPVRVITIEVLFAFSSEEELKKKQEELTFILHTDEPKPLIFHDEPDRTYYAVFENISESEERGGIQPATLTFLCPDPKKYGAASSYEFGSGIHTFTNPGYADIEPKIECVFTEGGTSYEVSLLNADNSVSKTIKILYKFIAGDTLVIDSTKRKVTCNGNLIMTALQIQSDWFKIPPRKPIKMNFSHKSSIKFDEAYL